MSLYIPNEYSYDGPWLLSKQNLIDLHSKISKIELVIIKAIGEINKSKTVKTKVTIETIITIVDSTKKILIESSITELLKSQDLETISPKELKIEINGNGYSPISFLMSLDCDRNIDSIKTRINAPIKYQNKIVKEVNFILDEWIDKNNSNIIIKYWSKLGNIYAFFPVILSIIIGVNYFIDDYNDQMMENNSYTQKVLNIIKDQNKNDKEKLIALESILKNYNLKQDNSKINYVFPYDGYYYIIFFIITISIWVRPKSVIGIGKNKYKLLINRSITWITFPVNFLPIVLAFISR